jgi:hypothetical protein
MTSLGLVERKQTSLKVAEKFIDPDNDASLSTGSDSNPNVTILHIYQEMGRIYKDIQENYKFILSEKQRRLEIGCALKRQNNFMHLKWIFFERKASVNEDDDAQKKIFANVDQRVFAFFPFFEQKELQIKLRTLKNDPIVDELIELAKRQNIEILPLSRASGGVVDSSSGSGSGSGADDSLERSLAEQKVKEEAEEKAATRRKIQEEEDIAASRPLAFSAPPPFEEQHFLDSGAIFLGGVNEDDLGKPIDVAFDESVSSTFELAPPVEVVPTEEEMNLIGTEIFKKDEIHKQILMALNHATRFYPPFVSITSPSGFDGKAGTNLQQTVYIITDAQEVYENNYSKIAPLRQMVVKFFPLVHLSEREGRYQSSQLWIRNYLTNDLIPLTNADQFSFLFDFAQKDYGTVIHKACVISNESGRVKNTFGYVQKLFLEDFERTLKTFEKSKMYSTLATDAPAIVIAAPVAAPAPAQVIVNNPVPVAALIALAGAGESKRASPAQGSLANNLRRNVPAHAARTMDRLSLRSIVSDNDNDSLF